MNDSGKPAAGSRQAVLDPLLTRHPVSQKHLVQPRPSDDEIRTMAHAGKMVSGKRAADPLIAAACCKEGADKPLGLSGRRS